MTNRSESLLDVLGRAGFRVVVEGPAPWSCTLGEGSTSWCGEGATAGEAAWQAFLQMMPSEIARDSLLRAWGATGSPLAPPMVEEVAATGVPDESAAKPEEPKPEEPEPEEPEPEAAEPEAPKPEAAETGSAGPTGADREPLPEIVAEEPSPLAESSRADAPDEPLLRDVTREDPPSPPSIPQELTPVAAEPSPSRSPLPRLPQQEALARLREQADDIRSAAPDLAGLAPEPIQLILLHWVTRMRHIEECCPTSRVVSEAGHRIANQIQELAYLHWPGNIPALQLHARPADCRITLRSVDGDTRLEDWKTVSEIAQEELRALECDEDLDGSGWGDENALAPSPNRPARLLTEVDNRFKKLSAEWSGRPPLPPDGALRHGTLGEEMVELAHKVRWLRGAVEDSDRWARLIGDLRRVALKRRMEFPAFAEALDPSTTPAEGSWAALLGQNPERKRHQRDLRMLYEYRPEAGADGKEVQAWFRRALDLDLDEDHLRHHLAEHGDEVNSWGDDTFAERSDRRRVRRLVKRLQESFAAPEDPALRERLEEERAQILAQKEAQLPDDSSDEEREPDPHEHMRAKILPWVKGKRVLFISNRADPNLERTLKEHLRPSELDWLIAEARKVGSAAQAIQRGKYDLVVCATGFVGHSDEKVIRDACEGDGPVPYVRAHKGRYVSVLRSIARDLGAA